MSKIDEVLEHAAEQWREEIDAGYVPLRAPEPRRRRNWLWGGGFATAAAALAAVVVVLATSSGGGGTPPNRPVLDTDCAGPVLAVNPANVHPGEQVTLTGKYYVTGCQDDPTQAAPAPLSAVPLSLIDSGGGQPVRLTVAHPTGDLGTFSVTVTIPDGTPGGRATISDGGSASVGIDVS